MWRNAYSPASIYIYIYTHTSWSIDFQLEIMKNKNKKQTLLIYIYIYIYMYVCMYVCMYVYIEQENIYISAYEYSFGLLWAYFAFGCLPIDLSDFVFCFDALQADWSATYVRSQQNKLVAGSGVAVNYSLELGLQYSARSKLPHT